MDKKTASGIMLTLLYISILTLAFSNETVKASAVVSPYIAVVPASTVDQTLTPGTNYTISIYTDYTGSDVIGYGFELTYNPEVLEGLEVVNGDLITGDVAPITFSSVGFNNTAGRLRYTYNGFFFLDEPAPTTSGPGTLANVTFRVAAVGTSNITLETQGGYRTRLIGYTEDGYGDYYNIIDSETDPDHIQHGYFSNLGLIRVFLDPPTIIDETIAPGTQFSFDISVEFVENLWSYQFWLSFDPEVLQGVSVANGPFLESAGGTVVVAPGAGFDNEVGELKLFAASIFFAGPPPPDSALPDGGGVLATVTFKVAGYGSSPINLGAPETGLFNKTGGYELQNNQTEEWEHCYGLIWEPYPWGGGEWVTYEPWIKSLGHGYFCNKEEEDIPPVASFSYSPPDPQIGETVIFDASKSYDPDGTIVSYAWDFGDGETSEETEPETTHVYTKAGTYPVALTVTDNDGLTDTATETLIIIAVIHDVAVTSVEAYPTQVMPGQNVQVHVIVRNEGTASETFDVAVYYDANLIGMKTVWNLTPKGYQSLWFEWNTVGVSEGTYTITAEASIVPGETDTADNTYVDGAIAVTVPSMTVSPASGPVGTMVRVEGSGFPTGSMGYIMFDDELVGFVFPDMKGDLNATFNVPLSEAGQHMVKAIVPFYPSTLTIEKPFTVIDTTPLDIDADVGAIYFKGETAAFYVQTSFNGMPVDATSIHATLHKPDGAKEPLTAQRIAVGTYTLEYVIEGKGSMLGTYTLIVNANYSSATINATGTTLKTFTVKSPWSEWERDTRNVALSVATIVAAIGLIFVWRRENKKLQI